MRWHLTAQETLLDDEPPARLGGLVDCSQLVFKIKKEFDAGEARAQAFDPAPNLSSLASQMSLTFQHGS